MLCWSKRCIVNVLEGSATIYFPLNRYDQRIADEDQRWTSPSRNELTLLAGKKREMFHNSEGRIRYAGTFKASCNLITCGAEDYLKLPETVCSYRNLIAFIYSCLHQQLQKQLLSACVLGSPSYSMLPMDEKNDIATRFRTGKSKVQCLEWRRIGFNEELFHRMVSYASKDAVRCKSIGKQGEDMPKAHSKTKKRRYTGNHPGKAKKTKHHHVSSET
jgi:hypothetical protein